MYNNFSSSKDDYNKLNAELSNNIIIDKMSSGNLNFIKIRKYDTFELIQFKNSNSIINVISLSAKEDYKL